jgi:hypothetical protein
MAGAPSAGWNASIAAAHCVAAARHKKAAAAARESWAAARRKVDTRIFPLRA